MRRRRVLVHGIAIICISCGSEDVVDTGDGDSLGVRRIPLTLVHTPPTVQQYGGSLKSADVFLKAEAHVVGANQRARQDRVVICLPDS